MSDVQKIGTPQYNACKTVGNRQSCSRSFRPKNYIKPQDKGAVWELRQDRKTQSLPEAKLAIVIEAIEKHNTRLSRKGMAGHQYKNTRMLKAELHASRYVAASELVKGFYRIAKSYWVGGKTEITVSIGDTPQASGYSIKEWHAKHQWSGCNAYLSVTIQPTWLSKVANVPGLAGAGGRLTTHAEQVAPDLWKASWVEQGRGFDLNSVSGYLLLADGEFYHGKSESQVRRAYKRAAKIKRIETLARTRSQVTLLVGKGENVPPEYLIEFPELVPEVNRMVQDKKRQDAEAALANNEPIDLDKLVEFPDLFERYHQQRKEMLTQKLSNGEFVNMDDLADYPSLFMDFPLSLQG